MLYLRQSTAVTVKSFAILASDDLSAETGLTIQKADVRLSKNGGNMAAASADQGASDAGAPHDELGKYDLSLNTTDTNTLGTLDLIIAETDTIVCEMHFMVVPANVYDSMVAGSDALDVSLIQWLGTAPLALSSQLVQVADSAGVTTLLSRITSTLFSGITQLSHWLGAIAGKQAANSTAQTEIRATGAGSGTYDPTTDSLEAVRDNQQTAAAAALTAYDPPTNAEMEARTLAAASYATAAEQATADGKLDTIQAVTDKLDDTMEDDGGTYRFTANALEQAPAGGGGGGDATEANQDIIIAHLEDIKGAGWDSGESLKAIGDKTTNLPSDPADASVVAGNVSDAQTAILAAISALNNLSSAQAQSAAAAALTAYDPPTRAEATSDKNEALAAIAALNNIAASDVLTQVNTALNTAISELGVGAPSATPTIRTALMFLYMALRNRTTTTATEQTVQNDAGATIATAAVSDDGTTFTKGEFA